ncbi:CpaF family protein [Candidatus Woesearchaeota archaeon]|nr:CpaF family protein [Candidatus Woesearchaeota archaeon]
MAESIEKYAVQSDALKIEVVISQEQGALPGYRIIVPEWAPATQALINDIRRHLITEIQVSGQEILDPKVVLKLKEKFKEKSTQLITEKLPHINESTRDYLVGTLLHEMLGLGKIEFLLTDPYLEEIIVNSADEPVRVYHKKYGWLLTNISVASESQLQNYASIIARRVGRQITTLTPLLDAHLVTGDRANAVLYPIATKGSSLTIRKFAGDPWTVTDFIKNNTCSAELFSLIWMALQYEMSVLVSGGTGSGKTSFLNVCMPFIPPNQRIISIEDTRELQLPEFLYWTPLITRLPNPEGKGEVTMLDLLVNALRMRPDRVVLGEVRRGRDAEVAFEAMHTGHSVYATVHADTIQQTIQRLIYPPINIAPNLLDAVGLNIVLFRDRRKGIRRVYQIGEFIVSEEQGKVSVKPNILYRWKPGTDTIVAHDTALKLFERLSRDTGMSQKEIADDLAERKRILEHLVKKNIRSVHEIGKVMNDYYLDPGSVRAHIKGK